MQHNEPFWLVWNPNGRSPSHKHAALEFAEREAARLARLHKGETFIVLESVVSMMADDIQRTDMRPAPLFEPPF